MYPTSFSENTSKRANPQPYQASEGHQIGIKRLNPKITETSDNNNL